MCSVDKELVAFGAGRAGTGCRTASRIAHTRQVAFRLSFGEEIFQSRRGTSSSVKPFATSQV